MSFVLALIAIGYVGDSSPFLQKNNDALKEWPSWFVWAFNPVAVTLCSVLMCSAFQAIGEFLSKPHVSVDDAAVGATGARTFVTFSVAIKETKARIKEEFFFYATLSVWLAQAVRSWFVFMRYDGFPVAFDADVGSTGNRNGHLVLNEKKLVMLGSSAILAIGLASKAVGVYRARHDRVAGAPALLPDSSQWRGVREVWSGCASSRLPSLLVGWGIGYWVISLLYLLACSWRENDCGWNNAPIAVTIISFTVIPCFLLSCVFMVADTNFLGARFGAFIRPAAEILQNRRRAEYWAMASVFRDFIVCWIGYCTFLSRSFS